MSNSELGCAIYRHRVFAERKRIKHLVRILLLSVKLFLLLCPHLLCDGKGFYCSQAKVRNHRRVANSPSAKFKYLPGSEKSYIHNLRRYVLTSTALRTEMLSKFNLAKPAKYYVDAVRPYAREHPTNIISVPLLEHYDRATQNMQLKTQTTTQFH